MVALASRITGTMHRSDSPLSDDAIRAVAPSIFALEAHEDRSQRYAHIPTIKVVNGLRENGFEPFAVAQTRVRDEGRREYTKHMVRLRHRNAIVAPEANEIIVLNSHDGTSGYQMLGGMIRFVCLNRMVIGDGIEEVRIRHSGNVVDNVIEGAHTILDQFEQVEENREEMKALTMNPREQQIFANAAMALRYDEPEKAPIAARQLLRTRRADDTRENLWNTFNVVQENLVRGGLPGTSASGRRTRTRAVTGVTQDVKLNRALWVLAEGMRELKG